MVYVEIWKPREKWLGMSAEERKAFISKMGENIGELQKKGVELLHFAIADENVPYRAPFRYIAVWAMPGAAAAEALEDDVEKAGFHDLFEQVNARGASISPEKIFADMIEV